MDGITIINQVISGGVIIALSSIVAFMFKINTALSRMMVRQEQQEARLMLLETSKPSAGNNGQHKATNRIAKRGGALTWALMALLLTVMSLLSGCQLFGLDMDQAQRDAQETSVAMELLVEKAEVISNHIASLEHDWQQAEADNNIERMTKLWPQLQAAYQDARLSKTELTELQGVFNKRITAFKEAKDTTGYLQAALGLFAGAASAFFPGLSMIRRRNRIIKTTARNVKEGQGSLDKIKALQSKYLSSIDRTILNKIRK
ncbi:MAG: hypothetical protein V3V10_02695 [Planctomycetota bacterium]